MSRILQISETEADVCRLSQLDRKPELACSRLRFTNMKTLSKQSAPFLVLQLVLAQPLPSALKPILFNTEDCSAFHQVTRSSSLVGKSVRRRSCQIVCSARSPAVEYQAPLCSRTNRHWPFSITAHCFRDTLC